MKEQQNGMSVIQLITVRNNRQQESRELWTATCRGKVCWSFPCSAPGLRLSVDSQLRIMYLKQKSLWMIPDSGHITRGACCLTSSVLRFPCSGPGPRISVESQLRIMYLKEKSHWIIPVSGTSLEVLVVLSPPPFGVFPAQVQVLNFLLILSSESFTSKRRVTEIYSVSATSLEVLVVLDPQFRAFPVQFQV